MKYLNKNLTIVAVLGLLLSSACENLYEDKSHHVGDNITLRPQLFAMFDTSTRTYLDEGLQYWHGDDRLSVFAGDTANAEYLFAGEAGSRSGVFTPADEAVAASAESLECIYALYPYQAEASISSSGVVVAQFAAEQEYAPKSFGQGANLMVAVTESLSDNQLKFKNVGGYLRLHIYGDATLRSIELSGNSGEFIAGETSITAGYNQLPESTLSNATGKSITLDCGEGVTLGTTANSATEFWFVLPAMRFDNGITLSLIDADGRKAQLSTKNAITISRNTVQPMAAIEVVFAEIPTSNELWYTTTSGSQLSLSASKFNCAIKSHTKVDGKWVVTFDGTLTELYTEAFDSQASLQSITLPDSVERIGDYAFYNCTSLTSIRLPESLTHIGKWAFRYCEAIDELTLLTAPQSFGSAPFEYSAIGHLTVGCNLEGTTLDNGALDSDPLFYGAAIEHITFTSDVDYIGGYSFVFNSSLESVEIAYGVTSIGDGAFMDCDSLTSVTFPASITSIGESVLSGCGSLVSVTSLAELPPTLGSNAFPKGTQVRVYDYAVTAYQEDEEWSNYILSNLAGERYTSTDYSEHGKVTTLQSASEGNGIDIVFMGDGYSDRQIAAGIYDEHIERAVEHFFSEEPYTTFRELFNIYKVNVVSREEGYSVQGAASKTALKCYIDDTGLVCGENYSAYWFAQEAIGDDEQRNDEVLVVVIMNSNEYGGTCYMSSPLTMPDDKFANGKAVAYFPLCGDDTYFRRLILHEAAGHGFAKLGDEYFYSGNAHITNHDYYLSQDLVETFGWYRNVDFALEGELTAETVKWRHFLADERYAYDGLGVFKGALTYPSGAYRPTDYSIMRSNEGGFNAPSREAIYLRIHKLAYGTSWQYNYEDFVAYDAKNRKTSASATLSSSMVYRSVPMPHEPVVVHE